MGKKRSPIYKQLGLSMDIETKVVQHVSSPKESNLTTLGSISNYHHLKKYELNSLTVGMYVWPEQENGDSI